MERTVIAILTVEDEVAFREANGPIDHLVKEFGRLKQSKISLQEAFIADEDETDPWAAYLNYLANWIFTHYGDEFQGMAPASYKEFISNEYAKRE